MEIPPATSGVTLGTTNPVLRFFQLKKIPDLDGDGLRDYWEWGGSVPAGVTIDDDRDNDGIPDSIEVASGSQTNDPVSLPAPSVYVDANASTNGDGSQALPFRDLQTAINAATNYSVVLVRPGTYSGASNRNLTFGTKRLVLVSERGRESTFIDPSTSRAFVFNSSTQDYHVQIIGFSISNALLGAISCAATSSPVFLNCAVVGTRRTAVTCTNASPTFINCLFLTNLTTTASTGAVVYATGAGSKVRFSNCTLSDNAHTNFTGQVYAAGGATITLHNTIIWATATNFGAELVANGGTIVANYSDVRGGYSGQGNFDADPLFETNGTARLRVNSPCIDQGAPGGAAGFALLARFDMDGEARLDHMGFAITFSIVDIGADEFVYRLQFPTVPGPLWTLGTNGLYSAQTNLYSEVDEASGVVFLGTNSTGTLIAVVDDEDRTNFHIYQLSADASAVTQSIPVSIVNTAYSGSDSEIADLEGMTFDAATRTLYLTTSQSKRNRYRNVDSSPPIVDPVIDPPANDYDRRRCVVILVQLDTTLTNVTSRTFFEPEAVGVPYNTSYEPTNGLAAHLRRQLTNNPALRETNRGNRVMIAWNTANKFGTPVNGVTYTNGASLPYSSGGTNNAAATSLGIIDLGGSSGTNTHTGRTPGAVCFYKIWAMDAQTNYFDGPVVGVTNNGPPRIYINEFDAAGDNETIEFYNPSPVAVSLVGCWLGNDTRFPDFGNGYKFTAATVPGRGLYTINDSVYGFHYTNNGLHNVVLAWTNATTRLDEWNMRPTIGGITEGRVWDGGPRGFTTLSPDTNFESCVFDSTLSPPSPYTTNLGILNHLAPYKYFDAVPDVNQTNIYLLWANIGLLPDIWKYSPKQHDFHSINIEDIAFRSTNELVFGLRAPLVNRTNGNAYCFVVTNVAAFLPPSGWMGGSVTGLTGALQMNLGGLGIRCIKWCPNGLTNSSGTAVARHLILAGDANGGPLQREATRQKFAIYAWDGTTNEGVAQPQLLLSDVAGYAVRPEGIDLVNVAGEWRVLFVEDRFQSTGYGTRNALHWPVGILGAVP